MEIIDKAREEVKETKQQFFEQTLTLVNGAFAFVAALAWNEAIKALIERYVPAGSAISSRFVYAIAVTFIVVIVGAYLNKISKKVNHEQNKESK